MKMLVFANNKGGVGKTPAAYYTAMRLAQKGLSVNLIDLDGQCTLTDMVMPGETKLPGIVDVLNGSACMDEALVKVPLRNSTVAIAAATGELYDLESSLSSGLGVMKFYNALRSAEGLGDVMIVDTPPHLGALTLGAIIAAGMLGGEIICLTRLDGFSISGIASVRKEIKQSRQIPGCDPHLLGVIATMDRNTTINQKWLAALYRDEYPPVLGVTPMRGGATADYDLAKSYGEIADVIWQMMGGAA